MFWLSKVMRVYIQRFYFVIQAGTLHRFNYLYQGLETDWETKILKIMKLKFKMFSLNLFVLKPVCGKCIGENFFNTLLTKLVGKRFDTKNSFENFLY